jgi:ADP-ribose pyrophosphatase YjhB (NUDIX family)
MMPVLGATVAIIDGGRVLLTKRRDFEVWCLPGGHVDDGETLAQAAMREAREETGIEVALTRLVGLYSISGMEGVVVHLSLFAARPIGGALCPQAAEVLQASYFAATALPSPMLWHHSQQIADALSGVSGIVRSKITAPSGGTIRTRAELYAARDRSGLAPADFYQRYVRPSSGCLEIDLTGMIVAPDSKD